MASVTTESTAAPEPSPPTVSHQELLERLRGRMRGAPPTKAAKNWVAGSKGAYLLYGAALHGAARQEAGLELTYLEACLVQGLRAFAETDEEIAGFGRVYREEDRSALFPDCLAQRPIEEGYDRVDLMRDLADLAEEIAAQPNIRVIDLDAPKASAADAKRAREEYAQAKAAYGYGSTLVTASQHGYQEGQTVDFPNINVRVVLDYFTCHEESDEWSESDELFWTMCAAADHGTKRTSHTPVYGSIDKGDLYRMSPKPVLFDGTVKKCLVASIEAWEKDHGSGAEIASKLRELERNLYETADTLSYIPNPAGWKNMPVFLALGALIAARVGEFVNAMKDDYIDHNDLTFDNGALMAMHTGPYAVDFIGRKQWGNKEGDFTLVLRAESLSFAPGKLVDTLPALRDYDHPYGFLSACAAPGSSEELWLFKGDEYVKYNVRTHTKTVHTTKSLFPNLPSDFNWSGLCGICAVPDSATEVYFTDTLGVNVVRYDVVSKRIVEGPSPMRSMFPGLPFDFRIDTHSICRVGNYNSLYFFNDTAGTRTYDLNHNESHGERPVHEKWPAVAGTSLRKPHVCNMPGSTNLLFRYGLDCAVVPLVML
ncbi:hypothetical protein [Streptomyces sp. NPDC023588]|uniref:hypothetical protein n=1 Tax=Streptomyces sp. NPDC023588 TaxID=3154907 RepID=UPI0033ECC039